jgi:hypothetical protein
MSTPPVTLASIRAAFATAIKQAGYQAYAQPLATVTPPGVVLVPGEPYLEANTLASGGIVWQMNMTLIVVVAYLDNQAALKNIEEIIVKVCSNLPAGTVFSDVGQPTVEEVGPASMLTCRIPVSIRANLTAPA